MWHTEVGKVNSVSCNLRIRSITFWENARVRHEKVFFWKMHFRCPTLGYWSLNEFFWFAYCLYIRDIYAYIYEKILMKIMTTITLLRVYHLNGDRLQPWKLVLKYLNLRIPGKTCIHPAIELSKQAEREGRGRPGSWWGHLGLRGLSSASIINPVVRLITNGCDSELH